ncbi:MAG: serine/threonine protein kinase [Myxococcaceae bacterium]|nr:serine/threonine protein kinase [Myxococcaceae bacterium]
MKRIGAGGMGEVYLTVEGIAVKRLLPHLLRDARFLELFLSEVKVAAQLSHPNIVAIRELWEEKGTWFVSMEYVPGCSLKELGRLAPGLVAQVGAQAAAALHHAHTARDRQGRSLGVVHRDVSPHNVLVSNDGVVKLIDFGVARATGAMPGKVPYLSPEVANGGEATALSDQFSLGVVLWELLTGKRLYKAPSDAVTLRRAAEAKVASPGVWGPLDEVVMRALATEPAERFADCGALKRALDDVLMESEPPRSREELAAAVTGRAAG